MLRTSYKTPNRVQKEEREVERNVKPAPKKKPPRDDRRRRHVQDDDPDLDTKDKDLSLNYKDVGGAAKPRPWKLDTPTDTRETYLVYDSDLEPHYFDDEDEAREWLEEGRALAEEAEEAARQKSEDRRIEKDEKNKTPNRVLPPTAKRSEYLVFDSEGKAYTFKKKLDAEEKAEELQDKDMGSKRKKDVKVEKRQAPEDSEDPYVMDEKTLKNIQSLQAKSSALPPGLADWLSDPEGGPPLESLRKHYATMDSLQLAQAKASLSKIHGFLNYHDPDDSEYVGGGLSAEDSDKIIDAMRSEIALREKEFLAAPVLKSEEDFKEFLNKKSLDHFIHVLQKQDSDDLVETSKTLRKMALSGDPKANLYQSALEMTEQHICNQSFESNTSVDGALKTLNREGLMDPSAYDFTDESDRDEFMKGLKSLSDADLVSAFKEIPVYGIALGVDGDTDPKTQVLDKEQRDRLLTYVEEDIRRRAFFNLYGLKDVTSSKLQRVVKRVNEGKTTKKQESLIRKYGKGSGSLVDMLLSIFKRASMKIKRDKTSARRVVAQYLGLPGPVNQPLSHMPPRNPWRIKNTFELDFEDVLGLVRLALVWYNRSQMQRQEEETRRRMSLDYAIYTYREGILQVAIDAPTYRSLREAFETILLENI